MVLLNKTVYLTTSPLKAQSYYPSFQKPLTVGFLTDQVYFGKKNDKKPTFFSPNQAKQIVATLKKNQLEIQPGKGRLENQYTNFTTPNYWETVAQTNPVLLPTKDQLAIGKLTFKNNKLVSIQEIKSDATEKLLQFLINKAQLPSEVCSEISALESSVPIIVTEVPKKQAEQIIGVIRDTYKLDTKIKKIKTPDDKPLHVQESLAWPFFKMLLANEPMPKGAKGIVDQIDHSNFYKVDCPTAPKLETYLNKTLNDNIHLKRSLAAIPLMRLQYGDQIPLKEVAQSMIVATLFATGGHFGLHYAQNTVGSAALASAVIWLALLGIDVVDNAVGELTMVLADAIAFGLNTEKVKENITAVKDIFGKYNDVEIKDKDKIKNALDTYIYNLDKFSRKNGPINKYIKKIEALQQKYPFLEKVLEIQGKNPKKAQQLTEDLLTHFPELKTDIQQFSSDATALRGEYTLLTENLKNLTAMIDEARKETTTPNGKKPLKILSSGLKKLHKDVKYIMGETPNTVGGKLKRQLEKNPIYQIFAGKSTFATRAIGAAFNGAVKGSFLNIPASAVIGQRQNFKLTHGIQDGSAADHALWTATAAVAAFSGLATSLSVLEQWAMIKPQVAKVAKELYKKNLITIPPGVDKTTHLKNLVSEELKIRAGVWSSMVSFFMSMFPALAYFLGPLLVQYGISPDFIFLLTCASSENLARLGLIGQQMAPWKHIGGIRMKAEKAQHLILNNPERPLSADQIKEFTSIWKGDKAWLNPVTNHFYKWTEQLAMNKGLTLKKPTNQGWQPVQYRPIVVDKWQYKVIPTKVKLGEKRPLILGRFIKPEFQQLLDDANTLK